MKILWHSVAPWVGSGYGMQTAQAVPRIKAQGHDVAISAYYGLAGTVMQWNGMQVLPAWGKSYGSDVVVPHAIRHFGEEGRNFRQAASAGLIITLGDVWTFIQPLLSDMNLAAWVPIDHETVPPIVLRWFEETGAIPIAMSRFGERLLAEAELNPLYVPHAIDTRIFCPGDKEEARERVGLPKDAFVVAMVAANVGKDAARKAFYEQILAFGELRRKHPDAVLALHTDVTNDMGVDIVGLLSDFPKSSYVFTDQYEYRLGVDRTKVADVYRAADILSNTSWGEGFGVPIVEAQACGTPVVVTNTTAMPELLGAGWKVQGEPLWHDSQRAWARKPLIGSIVDAYHKAYDEARSEDMRAQAWAFAQDYDADLVADKYWRPALEKLEGALERRREEAQAPTRKNPTERVRSADGFLWIDRGQESGDWIGFTDHEKELRPIIERLLPEGGVFLDVGAHVGHWAIRLAGKASVVYAVEANPATAKTLRRHLAMNDVENVVVIEVAAWDSETTLRLDDPNNQVAGGSTRTVEADDLGVCGVWVKADRLDNYLAGDFGGSGIGDIDQAARLDLVKIDVEGADLHVLRGLRGLLERFRPVLFIECHDIYGYYRREDLESLLTELGYDFEIAHSYETRWMPVGPSDTAQRADYLVCRPKGE